MTNQYSGSSLLRKYPRLMKAYISIAMAALFVIGGFSVYIAHASSAVLGVTQITAVQTFATADNTFADGWKWVFDVTVPTNQTVLKMKFADWVNGANIIPAGGNIQIYSEQSTNAGDEGHAIGITASSTWSDVMYLNPNVDLDALQGGRQIQIVVEARVPTGSAGGSYSTSYGINSTATSTVSLGDLIQNYNAAQKHVTVTTDPLGLTTSVTYNGSTTPPIHAGSYAVVATITDAGYTGNATDTLVINPASVTVTADPKIKAYDGATSTDPALTYQVTPLLFGTGIATDTATGTITRDPGEGVGTYNITQGTFALDGDYLLTFVPSTFVVSDATGTVTLGDVNQVYDKTGKSVSTTTDPYGLAVDITYNGLPTLPVNAGNYAVVATIDDINYTGSATGTLVISPLAITVTAASDTKVYDGTTTSAGIPTITSGALVSPDTAVWSQSFDTKDVGNGKNLIPYGKVSDGNDGNNYAVTFTSTTTGVITPATAAVTATGHDKSYDGTTAASTTLNVTGAVGTDVLSATGTALFDGPSVGHHAINVTGITVTGPGVASDDYSYNTTASTSANINPASLTITATTTSKIYGHSLVFTGTEFTVIGLISGDSVTSVTLTSNGTSTSAPVAGSPYPIIPSDATGTGLSNYSTINYINGSLIVTPKALVGTITASNKPYDGTNSATSTCSLTGIVGTDAVTCNTSGSQFGSKNVGTKSVTASLNLSGADAGNYTVNPTATTTADITSVPLTVAAVSDTKVYDGTTTSAGIPTITSGALVSPDTAVWSQKFDTKHVGTGKTLTPYGIVNDGNGGLNYEINFVSTTTGAITPAAATVTATGHNKPYDGTTVASTTLNVTGAVGTDVLSATGIALFDGPSVGHHDINVTGIIVSGPGVSAGDYSYNTMASTSADITLKNLIAVITAKNKPYDGTTDVSISDCTLIGVISPDAVICSTSSEAFDTKNVGTGKLVTADITLAGDIGNYTVTSPATTTADITALPLVGTITASNKIYDGTTSATSTCSLTGVIGGDVVTCNASGTAFNTKNAGSDTVSANLSLSGADAGNYSVNPTASTGATITPLALTVTALTNTKPYDGNMSALAIPSVSPAVISGETFNFIETYDTPTVGTGKTLTPSGIVNDGNGGLNYTYNYVVDTTGVISKAVQTITVDQSSIPNGIIDGNTFTLVASSNSGLPVTFTSNTIGTCSIDPISGLVTLNTFGTCSITVSQIGNDSYNAAIDVTKTFTVHFHVSP